MELIIKKYFKMGHSINFEPCEDGGFFVTIPDLPGCMSQGDTFDEAIEMIMDAKAAWIEVALKREIRIPLPGDHKRRPTNPYRVEGFSVSTEVGDKGGMAQAA